MMTELIQNYIPEEERRKWTRTGVVVVTASLILGFFLLVQELFLIPPFFPWTIPIYLLAWLVILLLWVAYTPARNRLLLLMLPGLIISFLGFIFLLAFGNYVIHISFIGSYGYEFCHSMPTADEHRLVCDGTATMGGSPYYFYGGPKYSPFIKPTGDGPLDQDDLSRGISAGLIIT